MGDTLAAWAGAKRLLCVRLDALGDVLMTGPAMRALKEGVPGRHITLLTSPAAAGAAALLPEVDEVMVHEAPWMKHTPPRGPSPEHLLIARLSAMRFDAAVIFTVYSQNPLPAAMTCYLAGIPLRLAHCRENPYQMLTDWARESEPEARVRHEVQRQLDLVAKTGCEPRGTRMSISLPEGCRERADAALGRAGIDRSRPWCVVHPGATAESRRYPAQYFAAAARELVREHGWQVLFTGVASEAALVEETRNGMGRPSASLAGQLDLGAFAAVLERAPLLIAGNTGAVHLAAAAGTPVVDIYALTNPQHGPWGVPHRMLTHDVPCRWCYRSICPEGHHACMRMIAPEAVVAAAVELAAETGRQPADGTRPAGEPPLDEASAAAV